jgi:predicted GNAT family acetyltransferase
MQQIQHISDGKKGSFYLEREGKKIARMDYVMAGETKLIIEHTEVDDSLKGQGIGKKLLEELVFFSRKKKITVRPLCSFAAAMFRKTPDWQDVLN